MFRGSIPADMRDMLSTLVMASNEKEYHIGCSGNFTVERTLIGINENLKLHSNDVNLYSVMIGRYFSGQDLEISLNPDFEEHYGFMEKFMTERVDQLACVMIGSNLTLGVGKESNPYYRRVLENYKKQFEKIHKRTVENISKTKFKLDSFFAGDVVDWMDTIPKNSNIIMYPPFFANDYTMQFKGLTKIFLWSEPEFVEMTEERKEKLIEKITEKRNWVLGLHIIRENLTDYLIGRTQTTNRATPIYLYSNYTSRKMITMPHQKMTELAIPRLGMNEDIGQKLKVVDLEYDVFCSMRSMYMNANIKPGSPALAFGVMVDDKLVGCFAVSQSKFHGMRGIIQPFLYLLSDFPVSPTKYQRLSKLILYAVLSKEMKLIFEKLTRKRVRGIITTAFSDNPVSMKYRGIFRLLKREKLEEAKNCKSGYIGKKFMLNYGQEVGNFTLDEGFKIWLKKHGKVLKHG